MSRLINKPLVDEDEFQQGQISDSSSHQPVNHINSLIIVPSHRKHNQPLFPLQNIYFQVKPQQTTTKTQPQKPKKKPQEDDQFIFQTVPDVLLQNQVKSREKNHIRSHEHYKNQHKNYNKEWQRNKRDRPNEGIQYSDRKQIQNKRKIEGSQEKIGSSSNVQSYHPGNIPTGSYPYSNAPSMQPVRHGVNIHPVYPPGYPVPTSQNISMPLHQHQPYGIYPQIHSASIPQHYPYGSAYPYNLPNNMYPSQQISYYPGSEYIHQGKIKQQHTQLNTSSYSKGYPPPIDEKKSNNFHQNQKISRQTTQQYNNYYKNQILQRQRSREKKEYNNNFQDGGKMIGQQKIQKNAELSELRRKQEELNEEKAKGKILINKKLEEIYETIEEKEQLLLLLRDLLKYFQYKNKNMQIISNPHSMIPKTNAQQIQKQQMQTITNNYNRALNKLQKMLQQFQTHPNSTFSSADPRTGKKNPNKKQALLRILQVLQLSQILPTIREIKLRNRLIGQRQMSQIKRLLEELVKDPRKKIKC